MEIDTMATTKNAMTKASAFAIALELVNQSAHPQKDEVAAKIVKELETLANKKSAPSKAQVAKQTANVGLGEVVLDFLRENSGKSFTVTDMLKEISGLPAEITNQKLTYILRMDVVKPFISKEMVKGKAMYAYKVEE
jgi:hypothetical protein